MSTAPARLYLLLALPLVLLLILFLDPVSHEKALPHFNEMWQPALARPFSTYLYTGIFLDYFPVFNYHCVHILVSIINVLKSIIPIMYEIFYFL